MRARLAALAAGVVLSAGCTPEQAIEVVFHRHGPEVVEQAKRVSWCESRWDNGAVNGPHETMFQLNVTLHGHRPGMDRRSEPLFAALAAEDLFKEAGGWSPWAEVCRP